MLSLPLRAVAATAVLALVGAGAAASGSGAGPATVARIVDGDTLVLHSGARVRLVQIDAPEAGSECYAPEATAELARLAPPGARIVLEADPALDRVDRYGRLLRYVRSRGVNVNVELVRRGAATPWFYRGDRGRYAATFLSAVSSARAAPRGMWRRCHVSWTPEGPVSTRPR